MRFSILFKLGFIAFTAAPFVSAYSSDNNDIYGRDIESAHNMLAARALEEYYDSSAVTARDLGEAIDLMIVQRQLAGENTQELDARLLDFIPNLVQTIHGIVKNK